MNVLSADNQNKHFTFNQAYICCGLLFAEVNDMYKRVFIFSAACVSIFIFGAGLTTLGSVAFILKERFNLNDIAAGTLFSILPSGILAGSLLFGPISDRYGYKLMLAISCICMFAGFEGIAFATSLTMLKGSVFLFGLGGGAINGGTSAVMADISKSKGAALSLLGVFYGIGALSMPFMLGLLIRTSPTDIISIAGVLSLLAAIFFLMIRFPPPKQKQGFPLAGSLSMLKDTTLLLIAFFLFYQSSFEGIINNWTTSYLVQHLSVEEDKALYALTLYLAGMTVIRLLIGTVFRAVPPHILLFTSLAFICLGCFLLYTGTTFETAVTGLICFGIGLGGNFPIMLSFVGTRYAQLSGTAFSIVLAIALIGNMLVNYLMGIIAYTYGIRHLITVAYSELIIMSVLCFVIVKKIRY